MDIIGISPKPLSRPQIFKSWHKIYSPRIRNNYIYEVVKDLYVEGFLNVSSIREREIPEFERPKKGEIILTGTVHTPWSKEMKRSMVDSDGEQNWEYRLSLKGFLLYLISTNRHNESIKKKRKSDEISEADKEFVSLKTRNTVITNLANRIDSKDDLTFLQYFEVFDEIYDRKTKVDEILLIVLELENLIKEMTSGYLKSYIIQRCYEEVRIEIGVINSLYNNPIFETLSKLVPRKQQEITKQEADTKRAIRNLTRLEEYKSKILDELIPIKENELEGFKEDLQMTKQRLLNPL